MTWFQRKWRNLAVQYQCWICVQAISVLSLDHEDIHCFHWSSGQMTANSSLQLSSKGQFHEVSCCSVSLVSSFINYYLQKVVVVPVRKNNNMWINALADVLLTEMNNVKTWSYSACIGRRSHMDVTWQPPPKLTLPTSSGRTSHDESKIDCSLFDESASDSMQSAHGGVPLNTSSRSAVKPTPTPRRWHEPKRLVCRLSAACRAKRSLFSLKHSTRQRRCRTAPVRGYCDRAL